jgi:hypothetical protein
MPRGRATWYVDFTGRASGGMYHSRFCQGVSSFFDVRRIDSLAKL